MIIDWNGSQDYWLEWVSRLLDVLDLWFALLIFLCFYKLHFTSQLAQAE